jgi:hypothetical protein
MTELLAPGFALVFHWRRVEIDALHVLEIGPNKLFSYDLRSSSEYLLGTMLKYCHQ